MLAPGKSDKSLLYELLTTTDVKKRMPLDSDPLSKEKIALIKEVKSRVLRARQRKFIDDADWTRLEPHIPAQLAPIRIEDLPEQLARPFTEKDGTRGRIVYRMK